MPRSRGYIEFWGICGFICDCHGNKKTCNIVTCYLIIRGVSEPQVPGADDVSVILPPPPNSWNSWRGDTVARVQTLCGIYSQTGNKNTTSKAWIDLKQDLFGMLHCFAQT